MWRLVKWQYFCFYVSLDVIVLHSKFALQVINEVINEAINPLIFINTDILPKTVYSFWSSLLKNTLVNKYLSGNNWDATTLEQELKYYRINLIGCYFDHEALFRMKISQKHHLGAPLRKINQRESES